MKKLLLIGAMALAGCTTQLGQFSVYSPKSLDFDNSQYTMADAVFTGCVLNMFLRHAQSVQMANYAPSVNTRGLIYTDKNRLVLRSTYHVFDLFVNQMGEKIVDTYLPDTPMMTCVGKDGTARAVSAVDSVATLRSDGRLAISLVQKHADQSINVRLDGIIGTGTLHTLTGDSISAYNDVDCPDRVHIESKTVDLAQPLSLPPHSVSVLVCD